MSEVSEKLKEQGNMCFKKGNIVEAMNFYEEAVNLLNCGDTEDFKTLRGVLFSNLALCLLKLSDWVGAIQACDASLLVDGGNIKAKLRKLQALYELDRYEDFLELFCEINASIPDCAKLSPLADVCKVVCKQRVRQTFLKIFKILNVILFNVLLICHLARYI